MITLTVFVVATWKLLPHTRAYGWLVLSTAQETGKGYVVQTEAQEEAALGQVGTAVTMLRPAGRGRFGSTTYSVVSRAEFIDEGTPIVIVQAEGNRYVVDKAKEEA
jgi:membrane-bound serine protease (ClpP class)